MSTPLGPKTPLGRAKADAEQQRTSEEEARLADNEAAVAAEFHEHDEVHR